MANYDVLQFLMKKGDAYVPYSSEEWAVCWFPKEESPSAAGLQTAIWNNWKPVTKKQADEMGVIVQINTNKSNLPASNVEYRELVACRKPKEDWVKVKQESRNEWKRRTKKNFQEFEEKVRSITGGLATPIPLDEEHSIAVK